MIVFSFSKLTIEHMKNSSKKYSDFKIFTDDSKIMTIDSFCNKVLGSLNSEWERCDKNVLSAKVRSLIED